MRTWIIFSAFLISWTIKPEMGYPVIFGVFAVSLIIIGFVADFVEFTRGG